MAHRRFWIAAFIGLIVLAIWVGLRSYNQNTLTEYRTTGTAFYHSLETQVFATWTP